MEEEVSPEMRAKIEDQALSDASQALARGQEQAQHLIAHGYTPRSEVIVTPNAGESHTERWEYHPRSHGYSWPDAAIFIAILMFGLIIIKGWPV